jgi:hypothetical protein
MTTEVATVTQGRMPSVWRAFADEALASAIAGDLLVFKKGIWQRGEEQKDVPKDARFLANMHEIWRGWVRWFNKQPVEHQLVRIVDGNRPPSREQLGHLDSNVWETDAAGEPRDPWSRTQRMVLKDMKGNLLTFTTSSWGGKRGLSKLCDAFDRERGEHPDCYPVVKLETEFHKNKDYGSIPEPRFTIVDWQPWDGKSGVRAKAIAQTPDDPRTMTEELDDVVPF